jgi:hypothetical protein
MKYISAKKKKLEKIRGLIQLEIRSGKCDRQDVSDLIDFLRITLTPYDERLPVEDSESSIN